MTKPTEAQKAEYYLISHGLYFRPEACGYTGIRDEAGLFDKSYAEDYSKNGDPVMVHKDDEKMAPEFMPAAYNDLVINHLKKQRDDALRTASAQQVDKCPDCGSPMMDVCSGLEKFSREGCDHTDATVRLQDREINPP